jgi:glycosyltransferase involved in cell wall biosynthesis
MIVRNTTFPRFAIIVPCYNEQLILLNSLTQLFELLCALIAKKKISEESFLYFVDDGSQDQTWQIIANQHHINNKIKGLRLSRNTGHQNALLAGLLNIQEQVDCAVTIDADLQDDIRVIETMLDHFHEGSDIVYGVRRSRKTDGFFKRLTALAFYKLMKHSGSDIIFNHADFRLLSRRVIEQLNHFKESNLFLRGIFSLIGFNTSQVHYDRNSRALGETKYTFRKMISLAWEGLISFSQVPLEFILISGIISFVASIAIAVWVLSTKLFAHTTPGWASIMVPLCFIGGIQLLSIGIIGEYLAKIYLEVKGRPRYIKDTELH